MGVYLAIAGIEVELADRVHETTQTTGTGTYLLDGVSQNGRRSFVNGIGSGNPTIYVAELDSSWEVAVGTVTAGAPDTLSRDFIIASSNGGSAVAWAPGVKSIFIDTTAALLLNIGSGLSVWCGSATGTNILAVGSTYPITSYFDGLTIRFRKNSNANTGNVNINLNNVGEVNLLKRVGVEIAPGELPGFAIVEAVYNADIGDFVCTAGIKSTGAQLSATRIYTSNATWTKPSGLAFVEVELIGGGGSGASVNNTARCSGGGGGAEFGYARILASALGSTVAVTVGAGGAAAAAGNNNGNAGGTSSFGTHLTALGGGGGNAVSGNFGVGGTGASGGTGTGTFYHIGGAVGGTGVGINIGGDDRVSSIADGGAGGGALGGGGGRGRSGSNGDPGRSYGGGGGGCSGSSLNGGAGAPGIVTVREFFE